MYSRCSAGVLRTSAASSPLLPSGGIAGALPRVCQLWARAAQQFVQPCLCGSLAGSSGRGSSGQRWHGLRQQHQHWQMQHWWQRQAAGAPAAAVASEVVHDSSLVPVALTVRHPACRRPAALAAILRIATPWQLPFWFGCSGRSCDLQHEEAGVDGLAQCIECSGGFKAPAADLLTGSCSDQSAVVANGRLGLVRSFHGRSPDGPCCASASSARRPPGGAAEAAGEGGKAPRSAAGRKVCCCIDRARQRLHRPSKVSGCIDRAKQPSSEHVRFVCTGMASC